MKSKIKGFTLIELMITVTIVGVLAAIALPAYQDYTIRAQLSEGISMTSGAKTFVEDYYAGKGVFPLDSTAAGLPLNSKGRYISGLEINNGIIYATFSSTSPNAANLKINGERIELTPVQQVGGNLKWSCNFTGDQKYAPTSCRG